MATPSASEIISSIKVNPDCFFNVLTTRLVLLLRTALSYYFGGYYAATCEGTGVHKRPPIGKAAPTITYRHTPPNSQCITIQRLCG